MTDHTPPTKAEVQAVTRRIEARGRVHLATHSEPQWCKDLPSDEDWLLLEGDSPEQRKADFDTLDRKREYERQQRWAKT